MMKALGSAAPLWNGARMNTVTSEAALFAAAREIKALGFNVKENLMFPPLDRTVHGSVTAGGWHYAYNGRGAIDVNWTREGANTSVERAMIDLYVIPILKKHGIRGILWMPRNRNDHKTWCHFDRGSYNDYSVRSWSDSMKKHCAGLIAKYRISGGIGAQSSITTAARPSAQNFGLSLDARKKLQAAVGVVQDGNIGPKTIAALQKKFGLAQDGFISKPSSLIKKIQTLLNTLRQRDGQRYFRLTVDGIIGSATNNALEVYLTKLNGKFGG